MTRVSIVGCGVVGASWTLVFARAGFEVSIYDADPAACAAVVSFVGRALAGGGAASADTATAGISVADSLEGVLAGADYVQESVSERLEIKRQLYRQLDELADPDTILASSTSGLPASSFTAGLRRARRCLVVHPINPPHLVPLVEIVPSPDTDPEVVERAADLMRRVGQSPIRLDKEINGFVVNRLQSALLGEAFRLVQDGVCSAVDVDKAISDGLGLRWFFMGPFETIDLNAQNGIAEYCRNLGPMYYGLAQEQADPREWDAALVAQIEAELRRKTSADALSERRAWRDRSLEALVAMKRQVIE